MLDHSYIVMSSIVLILVPTTFGVKSIILVSKTCGVENEILVSKTLSMVVIVRSSMYSRYVVAAPYACCC